MTSGGAVNVEPRFSPDGKRLAFVSTSYKGHFHIFVGRFEDGLLSDVRQLTPENVSSLPRYYYSQVDHEISPVWTRDGSEILFVSNRGHIHGTGGFWKIKASRAPRRLRFITPMPTTKRFITKKRTGRLARIFRRMASAWCMRRIWGRPGINCGSCRRRAEMRSRFLMALLTT